MAYDPNNLWNYGTNSGAVLNLDGSYTYGNGTAATNNARNYGTNTGAIPTYGPNGAISGYKYGSSGASVALANTQVNVLKKPTLNSQGQWVLPDTGLPAHGAYTDPATGQVGYYSNGKSVTNPGDIGIQTPVYTPTITPRQPQINAAADAALATQTATSGEAAKSFADYLAQAKTLNAQGAVQLTKDQAAIDPTATIARVNAATAKTTADLNTANRNYATQQQGVQGQVVQENVDYSKQVADRLAALDAEQANYEQKSQAVADQAFNAAKAGISLYQMGSGTPTSGSGNLSNRYIRSYDAINVPLQAQLSTNRSNLINLGRQTDQQLYQNKLSEFAGQAALNTDLTNRATDTTKYTGNLDTTTAQYIQELMNRTAGMSRAMAAQYLQQLAIPFDVGQHILSGDIQNLAGIQNLYNGANWYSVSQPYTGANVPQLPAYNVQQPRSNAPDARSYAPTNSTGTGVDTGGQAQSYYPYQVGRTYQIGNSNLQYADNGLFTDGAGNYWNQYGQVSYTNPNRSYAPNPNPGGVNIPSQNPGGQEISYYDNTGVTAPISDAQWYFDQASGS
jgi:hypothetical protein